MKSNGEESDRTVGNPISCAPALHNAARAGAPRAALG